MTVERGKDWGTREPIPGDAIVADSDRAAAEVLTDVRRRNAKLPPVVLTGGDLARTLGGGRAGPRGGEGTHVRVDLATVLVDGRLHWFLAHLVARRSWLRGRLVVVANAAFLGDWNIAPRAHPGDGRLDVLDGDPPFGDRLKARRRLVSGTHLPHPDVTVRRTKALQIDLERPTPIRLDGAGIGAARTLSVRVEQDAVDVWI